MATRFLTGCIDQPRVPLIVWAGGVPTGETRQPPERPRGNQLKMLQTLNSRCESRGRFVNDRSKPVQVSENLVILGKYDAGLTNRSGIDVIAKIANAAPSRKIPAERTKDETALVLIARGR